MATMVYMEALSPTMEEGRLIKWVKREGEPVKAGDTLAEVETDKAVMELIARADGVLGQVSVAEGETVPVGKVIAAIAAPGETVSTPTPSTPAVTPGNEKREAAGNVKRETGNVATATGPGGGMRDAGSVAMAAAPTHPASPIPHPAAASSPADATQVKASPLARRIAKETGVDLKLLQGSGPGGRVIKRDLERTVARGPAPAAVAAEAATFPVSRVPFPAAAGAGTGAAYEDVPLTQIRKTIAKRLVTSLGPIPHYFLTAEVDMERAAEARDALNRQLGEQGKLSFNDIIIKATALALTKHRACNAWFQEDHIRYWNEVHIGMAVAVEDGLITPVIRHADQKPLAEIGREARALAEQARNRRLQPADYTGATFSVSNLGMFDIDQFTAVINPPEAGILAVGSIVQKPVGVDDRVAVRRRMRVTLSCDHRVIDGATGAAFLQTLKQMLENPLAMLL